MTKSPQPQSTPQLAIVVPCYNEEAVLPYTLETLSCLLQNLIDSKRVSPDSYLYCVDDGSNDKTWNIISEWHHNSTLVKGLKLTRNMGHQNALLAGLLHIKNKMDCAISIDADLQDDINVIDNMLDNYMQGYDIVYGVRISKWTGVGLG